MPSEPVFAYTQRFGNKIAWFLSAMVGLEGGGGFLPYYHLTTMRSILVSPPSTKLDI